MSLRLGSPSDDWKTLSVNPAVCESGKDKAAKGEGYELRLSFVVPKNQSALCFDT